MAYQTKAFFQALVTAVQADWIDVFDSVQMLASAGGDVALPAGAYLQLGTWATAGRPAAPTAGMIGWNTTLNALDYYDGVAWTQSTTHWVESGNNLIPTLDNSYDLGDATHQVRSLYLGTSALLASAGIVRWSTDLGIARLAAASLRIGLAPSAAPIAQTLTVGEASRPSTDANVGGANGTIRSGLGTGTGTVSILVLQTPTVAAAGSGAQSYTSCFVGLGGTSNAFPAIKIVGTQVHFRLADDSGFASLAQASNLVANDATNRVILSPTTSLVFGGVVAGLALGSGMMTTWDSSADAAGGTPDLGVKRASAGLLEVNSGTAGTLRDLTLRSLKYSGNVNVSVATTTMAGTRVLTSTSAVYQFLDPDGSDREVDLPAETTGMSFVLAHIGGANTITVKDNSAATVTTLTTGQIKTVIYDGTVWQVLA